MHDPVEVVPSLRTALPNGYGALSISQKIASYPEHHLPELDLSQVSTCDDAFQYDTFKGSEVRSNGMLTLHKSGILLLFNDDVKNVVQELGWTYSLEMLV